MRLLDGGYDWWVRTGHQLETKDGITDNTTISLIATDAAFAEVAGSPVHQG